LGLRRLGRHPGRYGGAGKPSTPQKFAARNRFLGHVLLPYHRIGSWRLLKKDKPKTHATLPRNRTTAMRELRSRYRLFLPLLRHLRI
jgi:hypothetical protein